MTALLDAQKVSKAFRIEKGLFRRAAGHVQALQDVSIRLEAGEVLAVVGGSGSGKSTLARLLTGLLEPDQGVLLWKGQPLLRMPRAQRARCIQMVFQDPYASLNPKLSVAAQLAEGAALTADSRARMPGGMERRCIALLESVGLPADALPRYPFQFSGGQRQRIALARALAVDPEALIADEPLSALDVTIQAQMLALFKQLRASRGLSLVFITHDLAAAEKIADRVAVLQDGRLVEEGRAESVLRQPQHVYTRALAAAVPRLTV